MGSESGGYRMLQACAIRREIRCEALSFNRGFKVRRVNRQRMDTASGEARLRSRLRLPSPTTVAVLLFSAVFGSELAKPQPSGPAVSVACALSGQSPESPFDPNMVEFVSAPKPIADGPSFSVQMIARVVGLSPLVFEVLDMDVPDQGELRTCHRQRIYSVDSQLRGILPQLGFNDRVRARMVLAYGGAETLVLSDVEKIPGEPAYFHERPRDTVCSNRSGTLVVYQQPTGEVLSVHNDGSIDYRDTRWNVFDRQRLGPDDVAQLMQSFQDTGFDKLANVMPPVDKTQGQPSITLICARHQRVLVPGKEAALAPVIQKLELVKAKALAQSHYLLKYDEKRQITFLSWPFSQLPIEEAQCKIEEAASEQFAARCAARPVRGDFRMFHQELPAEFFAKLPANYSRHRDADPNRDAYVQSGSRIYRVTWLTCGDQAQYCGNLYKLSQLVVTELVTPDYLLMAVPAISTAAAGNGCRGESAAIATPSATGIGCSALSGIRSVRWPANAGVALRSVPGGGQSITSEDYSRHEGLYRELLAAGSCGDGIDFVEGPFWYRNVRMLHLDRASQPQ